MSQAVRNQKLNKYANKNEIRKGRLRFGGLFFLLIVLLSISVGAWLIFNWMKSDQYMPLSKLVITGERHFTTDNDIRSVILQSKEMETLISQDVNVLQNRMKEEFPWIKQVIIRKHWPDELIVHISEYVTYAYWNDNFFMDRNAILFSMPKSRLKEEKYPLFYGAEGTEKVVLESYVEINEMLKKVQLSLALIEFTPRHSWTLILDNGIKLELGRQDKIARLQRFVSLYPHLVKQTPKENKINYVDLRYKNGAAVGYTPII